MKTWYNKKQEQIEKYKYFIMLNLEHDELKELSKKDKVVERYMEDLNVINSDPVFIQHMADENDALVQNTTYLQKCLQNKDFTNLRESFILQ